MRRPSSCRCRSDRSPAALDTVVDAVRRRFGNAALTRGALIGLGEGLGAPLLPGTDGGDGLERLDARGVGCLR